MPIFALAALTAGCSGDFSALDPAGPAAGSVAQLWWVMFAGSVLLFTLVMGLFVLTMLRPGFGSVVSARTWIVSGGLLMPVPILTLLVYYSLFQGERLLPQKDGTVQPLRIEAKARQWEWEFHYLNESSAPSTVNVLHIPAGQPVDVIAVSEDVIHSFWVPRLGGKVDATPGHAAQVRLLADRAGRFGGLCAEYCGRGHAGMRFWVEAHEPEDFAALAEKGFAE
ncbi:cytochrome c oxidase subunit II [Chelativorans sp. AA-79]|uniref:cytochrome c oxidase subunit II n=1 Tax=Chelativorans sp. AA-79 TaxID=3028735 RepID=UPI0023F79C78|nr:cytochrome c oxidase subunit II [Chelativorans sp. AA-79]WEX10905.1 cytochrome c oxidase subunit II [Chelativorans sp. AA-79]